MIVNIRGCNGSGKTTVARAMLEGDITREEVGGVPLTVSAQTALVGPYEDGKCGGCDRIKTFAMMREAIREASARRKIVIFEGVIVSTVFGSWEAFCREVPFVWAFLDTPLEICLQRIQARNGGTPIKEDLVAQKWESVRRVRQKAISEGFQVLDLPYQNPVERLREFTGGKKAI